ncbi:uncharacterized protein YMR317W-like [Lingula anatina]|uniref:Uncharacterized protein YMR317W-like n=1 Tax=Lingula anatina TaxID=7574 RepID=A0A1S3HJR7_LINAN|nr:uncharacterized protein YMR317W-like [Lingula anatina]|eukprot:XP_013386262.2 uncharacterized protein YMR317W-like [Lingula anatina]
MELSKAARGPRGCTSSIRYPHVGTTSHTQSVSQITMHHTGTLAAAQGLSQIQRARMSAPLPQYNRSPQRARTQQTTQQNTAPQNQMVVQERSYPEVTHVPNSRADLVGEPRVHTQPAQPHHRFNQYSDIMAKNITQTTEKYQFPLRTVTNATTAELVGQPRVKQSLPDYKLGQVPDSTARHETTGKLSEYSADTTHVLASRAVFAYHKAAMHYAKSKMAAGTLQQHSSASIEITSGHSVDAVKSGHLNDTSTSHFGISRENMPSLGNQKQANSNNTNCTGRTTGQPAFGHQRSTVTALPDNNANMRVQNDDTYQAESTKADNTRPLSKNDGVPRQHSLKEDFIRAIKKYEVFNVNPLDVMKLRNASESAHSGSIVNGTPWTPANKTEAADAATNAAEGPTSDSIRTRSKKQRSDNQVLVPVSQTSGAKVVQGAVVSNHFSTNESCSRHENIATPTSIAFLPFQITHPITANVSRATHSYTSTHRNTERQNLSLSIDPSGQSLSGRSATATSAETSAASSVTSSTSSKVTQSVLRDTSSTSVTPLSSVPNLSAFMPTGQGNKSPPSPVRDSHQDGPQTVVPSTRPASMLQAIEQSARAVTYRDYKKPTPVTSKIVNNKGSNKPGSSNRPNTRCRAPAPSGECNATDEDELIKYRSSLRMPPQLLRTKMAPNPVRSNTAGVDNSIKPYISVTKASVSPAKSDPGNSGRYADSNTKKETGNPIKSEPIKGELCNKETMLSERCGNDAGKDSVQSDVSKMTCIKGEPTTETQESHSPKGSAIQTKSPNRKGNRKPGNRKDTKVQPKRRPKGEKAKCKAELLQTTIDTREFSEKFVKTFGRKHSQGLFETLSKSLNVSSALNDNTSNAQSNQSASGKDVAKVSPGSRTEKSPSPTDNSKKDDILTNEEIKNIWCRMKMEKQQEKEVGDTSSVLTNEPPKSVTISPERDDKPESINAKRNSPKTMKFTTKKFSMNLKKLSPLMRKASQALMQEMQRRGHLTRMNGSSGAASGKKSPRLSPKRPSTPIKSKSLRAESPFNSSPRESPVKMEIEENELEKRNTIEQTAQEETKPVPKKEKEATRPILQRRGRQLLRNQDFDSESGSRDTSLESRDTSLDSQGRPSSRTRRTRMLEEIANTDGFVAERRGRKIEDLFAHPSELDREARWLQRAMMKFTEMETKPDGDDLTASRRRRNPNASALTKAAQLRRRACRFTNKSGLTPQKFSDFSPEILPTRTRGTGLERIRRRSYNKNAAYEAELSREEERLELKRANRQAKRNREQEQSKEKEKLETSTEMSVDEGDESQVDADDISPVRGRRKKRGGKQSTGSRGSKRTKKVEVKIDYAGCEDADTDEYYYEDNYAYEGVSEDLPSHLHDELNDMIDDGTTQSEEQFDKPAETNDSCAQDRRTPPLLKKLTCSKTSGETVLHRAARMGYESIAKHVPAVLQ